MLKYLLFTRVSLFLYCILFFTTLMLNYQNQIFFGIVNNLELLGRHCKLDGNYLLQIYVFKYEPNKLLEAGAG